MTRGLSRRIGVRQKRAVWALAAGAVFVAVSAGEGHNPLTSKYTYNDHVFPILRDKCGTCHVSAGVAPMSLMTFKDALPWSESIRTELMSTRMPPWDAEVGVGAFRDTAALSARELDVVLTWATGGTPPGDPDTTVPPVTLKNDWRLGPPDLALRLPAAVTLGPGTIEETREFTIATGITEDRGLRAVDLLPGTPAIVVSATISVKGTSGLDDTRGGLAAERLLALWVPGHGEEALDSGAAFRLPAGADLIVRIRYKKTWMYERESLTDHSTIGLYFAPPASDDVLMLRLHSLDDMPADGSKLAFGRAIDEDMQVLAFHLDSPVPNGSVKVDAVLDDGSRLPLIHFKGTSVLRRRYWSAHPIRLPRGTRIEVVATGRRGDLLPPLSAPGAGVAANSGPVEVTLDVIPVKKAGSD
jgi:hypothetical protein